MATEEIKVIDKNNMEIVTRRVERKTRDKLDKDLAYVNEQIAELEADRARIAGLLSRLDAV